MTKPAHKVLLAGLFFTAAVFFILVITAVILRIVELNRNPETGMPSPVTQRPADLPVQLEVSPKKTRIQLEERAQTMLNSYGWVDRERGIVRVPIERAIDLRLRDGYPVRTDVLDDLLKKEGK